MQGIYEAPMTATIHSIWLMAKPEDESLLSGLVTDLAGRFGTPLFTPHLTVRGDTTRPAPDLSADIAAAAAQVAAFAEAVEDIETSEAFFRSFYARFAVAPPLAALKRRLDPEGLDGFLPHVSLLYGPVPDQPKAEAAGAIRRLLNGRAIAFDRLCVVTSGQDVPIADWTVVATARLGG